MNFVEVNVEHVVLHGVELELLEHGLVVYAIDRHVDEVDVGRVDELVDFLLVYGEVGSYGIALFVLLLSVENTGNHTVLAKFLRGLLADVSADSTADCNLLHLSFKRNNVLL